MADRLPTSYSTPAGEVEANRWFTPEQRAVIIGVTCVVAFVGFMALTCAFADTLDYYDDSTEWGNKVFNISEGKAKLGYDLSFAGMFVVPLAIAGYARYKDQQAFDIIEEKTGEGLNYLKVKIGDYVLSNDVTASSVGYDKL